MASGRSTGRWRGFSKAPDEKLARRHPGWRHYYQAVAGRPPRDTTLVALDNWEAEHPGAEPGLAVDLGAGDGRDTVEFLRRGWRVIAIDRDREGIERLRARSDLPTAGRLDTVEAPMEDAALPAGIDIVNASFALPFCAPDRFPELWERIVAALKPGGRLATQLFGPDDSWAKSGVVVLARDYLDILLTPFDIEHLVEENRAGKNALGNAKHWHIYHLVARKR